MQGPKISLSAAELALACNAEVILTKNSVIQKTVALLASVQEKICQASVLFSSSPKISKGENYLGLPYAVLDYPRIANGDDLLFIRSFFWWGNFFSSTLQLAGCYKQKHLVQLKNNHQELGDRNYFVGVNPDPWVHHFEPSNFQPINRLSKKAFAVLLDEMPHAKIAGRWPLDEWGSAVEKLVESWSFLAAMVKTS